MGKQSEGVLYGSAAIDEYSTSQCVGQTDNVVNDLLVVRFYFPLDVSLVGRDRFGLYLHLV